jgi:flagellar hook-basal body complex protein FliE
VTVTIPAIGQLAGAAGLAPAERAARATATGAAGAARTTGAEGDFGNVVVNALENLEAMQDRADGLAVQAASGDLTDVHDYMIAATEASLATEYTVAVRNRAVEAFNEIMRMQI